MIPALCVIYLLGCWLTAVVTIPSKLDTQRAAAAAVFWPIVVPYAAIRHGGGAIRWILTGLRRLR